MQTVFVTGGDGFIGRYLIDKLKDKYKVRCLVRKRKKMILKNKEIEIVYGDLLDKKSLLKAVKGVDKVVHLAAIVGSSDPKLNYAINVIGSKNLIEACIKNKVKRAIYVSTVSATRKRKGPYGKTKLQAEKLFLDSPLKVTILRPTMVYGKNSRGLHRIVKYVKLFPFVIPIVGSGKYTTQPVYIEDVVSAIISSLEREGVIGKIYDIAGPDIVTFNELVDIVSSHLGIRKCKLHIPILICSSVAKFLDILSKNPPFTAEHIRSLSEDMYMNITPAKKDLGFNPIGLNEGLKKVLVE